MTQANCADSSPDFNEVLQLRLSRRGLLKGSLASASASYLGVGTLAATGVVEAQAASTRLRLNFNAVAKSLDDLVRLPTGYSYKLLLATGDPIAPGIPAYSNAGADEANSFSRRAGDHNDGMYFFGMNNQARWDSSASERALLCVNHEAITSAFLHPQGQTIVDGKRTVDTEVVKEMLAHGVSVIEVRREAGSYSLQKDSLRNRRITTMTEIEISGPASGSPLMVTRYSPTGKRTRGTLGNCANGHTPWGTYLTCEENWAGYFRRPSSDDAKRNPQQLTALKRYGIAGKGRELWATASPDGNDQRFSRWDASVTGASADGSDDYRHAPNTFGWVVEIDPFNTDVSPKKRTALGRFAHEGAWPGPVRTGQPLVWYMGCDARGEYIYKFVSTKLWDPADATKGMAAGDKYMDDGRLYAARFNADGSGDWLELSFGQNGIDSTSPVYPFANQADVLVHARLAADAVGATKMDRPEWGAVNPRNGEVYMTLTYNPSRDFNQLDAANPRFYRDAKAGKQGQGNVNGHIIRWAEQGSQSGATHFRWDVFLFASRDNADQDNVNVSGLDASNDFSSPDGLWFSRTGLLWIETDDHAYRDSSNCMLLAAIPGTVGDGGQRQIISRDGEQQKNVTTHVGASATMASLRRFLVGPVDCEITGLAESPDGKALFVNIQHLGETTNDKGFDIVKPSTYLSHWPAGGDARPRSATIVITRDDGGTVGADLV
ncbi:MAG: PhoX family phosphatase [Betaproteobacteria bacterium]|nr:PhoX family phosphatase [Betaproteobacteria bacterium]